MTDHANELRRYSRKIGHPAGDVPSVMLAAADEIERLAAMLEEAESDALEQARLNGMGSEREAALMAKLEAAERTAQDYLRVDEEKARIAQLLEAAENENAKLREALAQKVTSEIILRDLNVGNGSINASFEGGAVHLLVDSLATQFVESGAPNYIEMQFHSEATGPLVVTLQRVNGKTPHQLRAEAEKERDALRARIEAMEQQEPVAWRYQDVRGRHRYRSYVAGFDVEYGALKPIPLYALPGAQPAPSLASGDVSRISGGKTQPAPSVPKLHVGNLPTVNQDAYPALGAWWVQLWDGDSVFARVYGASPEEASSRAAMLAAVPEAK